MEKPRRRPTVLIADDHPIVVDGLVALLKDRFDVVGTVSDGTRLLDDATRLRPDIVVTDISMPGLDGLEVLRRLKAKGSDARVIVLTMHAGAELATEAMRHGASGFVLKQSASDELVIAINEVLQGRTYLTPAVTRDVIARMAEGSRETGRAPDASPTRSVATHHGRTSHERNSRPPERVHADGRDPQVRDDAGAWRADDR